MPALESQLIISADDRTAAAFASVQEKLSGLESTMAALDQITSSLGFAVPLSAPTGRMDTDAAPQRGIGSM